jgi:PAC2 family
VNVADVLSTHFEGVAPLNRPIMVLALRGWFDIAEVATTAINELFVDRIAPIVATIDPDPFFDFTQERPFAEVDDDDVRHIRWPENEFRFARFPGAAHDLVVLSGVEPHLRYATFADSVLEVATLSKCEVVVTVGAVADTIPHTRPPLVVGSTTNESLLSALGLSAPRYQGITGLVGVLQERLDRAGMPAVSLRVGVPHYLGNVQHPQSSIALLQHLHHVLGVPVHTARLAAEAARRRVLHDEAVADDEQASAYVAMLEREYDQHSEAAIPSADDLAAEFERFLRDQRDDGGFSDDS